MNSLKKTIALACAASVLGFGVAVAQTAPAAPDAAANPAVARWYKHIKSYAAEHADLPGSSAAGEAFLGGEAAAPAAEDDDEVDLFGSDDEEADAEAERVKAERVAAYNAKKANKPKTIAKVRYHSLEYDSKLTTTCTVRRHS